MEIVKNNSTTWGTEADKINAQFTAISKTNIVCWGDSLTNGYGGEGTTFETVLRDLIDDYYTIISMGAGGEDTTEIAARQGGIPAYIVNDITLPATITNVLIGDSTTPNIKSIWNDADVKLLVLNSQGVNPVFIDGVECTLTYTAPNYYLKRTVIGDEVTLKAGSAIYTNGSKIYRDSFMNILWLGTNQGFSDTADFIAQTKKLIEYSGQSKFIVIGLHVMFNDLAASQAMEKEFTKAFGLSYLNIREYLVNHALDDMGITPTQNDLDQIALGLCPPSLIMLNDTVHFNADGYTAIGRKLYSLINRL